MQYTPTPTADPRGTTYLEFTANSDGTHSGIRAAIWLYWSQTGKVMTEAEARDLVDEAMRRGAAKRAELARNRADKPA